MFGSRTTKAMVDCRKQQPQQMTTTIGTLGGLIGKVCGDNSMRFISVDAIDFKTHVKTLFH
jgi:hypothetical protein